MIKKQHKGRAGAPTPSRSRTRPSQIIRGALPGAVLRVSGLLLRVVDLDEYWVYSAFTLVMLLLKRRYAFSDCRNLEQLRSMQQPARLLYAYRQKKWRPTMSDDLVPGDIIALST